MKLLIPHITTKLKHSLSLWILIFNLSLGSFFTLAQNYPVQVSINATGPFYNYLPYYSDQNNHLQIIAILTDFNTSDVNVKLRLRIEGPGYELHTNPNFHGGNTFLLSSGMPEYIQGIDLAPLLTNSSLIKQPGNFDLNNLPEGFTTICVDVIKDGPSGEVLSTNNCFSFFLQKFQPPMPQLPFCETQLDPQLGFYTFQWSPPVGYTPTINSQVEYEFELYEWVDRSNYNIFQTGQGLVYTEVTDQTLVQLSSYDVLLQEGLHYVWRVKATILDNGLPVQMIEQDGISAPCSFQFGQAQTLEESLAEGLEINLSAQGLTERKGKASWTVIDNTPGEGLSNYSSYIIEYRKKPTGNEGYEFSWFQDTVTVLSKDLFQLEPSTTYECKVYGRVGSFTSEPTDVIEFTTSAPRVYACGDQGLPYRSPNYVPLEYAEAGMKVEIGQFIMQLDQVYASGGSGRYSGKGTVPIDFLMGAQAKVTFEDILIDNQFIVREGRVDVMTDGVDAWLHEQYKQFIDPIYVSGQVNDITVDTTSGTGWIYFNGDSLAFEFDPPDYPVIVHDDEGNSYTIYPDGNIENGTYFAISDDQLVATAENAIHFKQHESENFGFDAKKHTQWHAQYEIIQLSDSSKYFVSNKSLGVGQSDKVNALIPEDLSGITFQLENGDELTTSESGGSSNSLTTYEVEIPAFSSKGEYAIYAYAGNARLGKLNIHVYEEKEIDVVVVPVANVTLDSTAISTTINDIFNDANIKINLSTAPQWNNATFTPTTIIETPSDVTHFSKYSDDMRNLRDTYFDSLPNADKSKYYLFVVDGFSGGEEDGYMVRGKGVGFVSKSATPLTYAHELGHGAGALEHTWNDNGPEQGETDNLMDYSGGQNLTAGQWKDLRKMNLIPSFWDSEEDGKRMVVGISNLITLRDADSVFTFYKVNGRYISLPASITNVTFSTLDRFVKEIDNKQTDHLAPIGSLIAFTDAKGDRYLTDLYGRFRKINKGTNNTYTDSIYVDLLTENRQPTEGITAFFSFSENDIYTHAFKIASPIKQSDYTLTNAKSLDRPILFETNKEDRKLSVENYLQKYWKKEGVNIEKLNLYFSNSDIDIQFHHEESGGSGFLVSLKNLSYLDLINGDENSSVNGLLSYFQLLTLKKTDFQTLSNCIEQGSLDQVTLTQNWFQQKISQAYDFRSYDVNTKSQFELELEEGKEFIINKIVEEAFGIVNEGYVDTLVAALNTPIDDFYFLIEEFYNSCIIKSLEVEDRIAIIDKLLVEDDEYWLVNNEFIIYNLFENIPNNQEVPLVKAFIDNNWLSYLWSEANGFFGASILNNDVTVDDLSSLIILVGNYARKNAASLNQYVSRTKKSDIKFEGISAIESISYYPGESSYFITPVDKIPIAYGDGLRSFEFSLKNFKVDYLDNNRVWLYNNFYNMETTLRYESADYINPFEGGFEYNETYKPLEPVRILFTTNAFSETLGYSKDQEYYMTAMEAMVLQKIIISEYNNLQWRQIGNFAMVAGAIAASPFSGGTSLVAVGSTITTIGGFVGAADMVVTDQIIKNNLDPSNIFYQEWNDFYQVYGIIDVAASGGLVINGLKNLALRQFSKKFNSMKLDLASQPVVVRDAFNTRIVGKLNLAEGVDDLVRGVSKSAFKASFTASDEIAEQAWTFFKNEDWASLENLFNTNNLNKWDGVIYPPNNGAINIIKKTLDPSDFNGTLIIDRYGPTTGKFTSPVNTPFPERALPASYGSQTPQKYEVVNPIPNVEEGQIIPWFGQQGLGTQYKFEKSVQYYIDEGYIIPIP